MEVSWTPGSTLGDGVTGAQGYYVTRSDGTTTYPACGTSPASLTAATSCTDGSVPDGAYTYGVTAVWASFSAQSGASEAVAVQRDTTVPAVASLASAESSGAAGDGRLQNGDRLIVTFNDRIDPASVGGGCATGCTIAGAEETRTRNGHVFLVVPGVTAAGGADTGTSHYLEGSRTATATFTVTAAFSSNDTTLTLTVSELAGSATAEGSGELSFTPAATIVNFAGTAATGTFKTATAFKLF